LLAAQDSARQVASDAQQAPPAAESSGRGTVKMQPAASDVVAWARGAPEAQKTVSRIPPWAKQPRDANDLRAWLTAASEEVSLDTDAGDKPGKAQQPREKIQQQVQTIAEQIRRDPDSV